MDTQIWTIRCDTGIYCSLEGNNGFAGLLFCYEQTSICVIILKHGSHSFLALKCIYIIAGYVTNLLVRITFFRLQCCLCAPAFKSWTADRIILNLLWTSRHWRLSELKVYLYFRIVDNNNMAGARGTRLQLNIWAYKVSESL